MSTIPNPKGFAPDEDAHLGCIQSGVFIFRLVFIVKPSHRPT